jgi:hypothetical protein
MKTETKNHHHSVLQQVTNNTTSWLGQRSRDSENIITGQTFVAPSEGDLETIEVFSSIVSKPGKVTMTLYSFDQQQHSWGNALGSASVEFKNNEAGKWVAFNIPGTHLDKGKAYGFRLESQDSYVGVGEAVGCHLKPPYGAGQEWQFTTKQKEEHCYSYFSLAFKVGVRA